MNNYKELNKDIPDIQNTDTNFIKKHIHKVGINNYKIPLKIYYPSNDIYFNTIARVSAYASLSEDKKGIDMSRFSECITHWSKDRLCSEAVEYILKDLKDKIKADNCYVKFRFDYLVKVNAPKSKIESWFNIPVMVEGNISKENIIRKFVTTEINYTSLCPCSKEISSPKGAHNQRSMCRIKVETNKDSIYFEEFKEIVDKHSSYPIYNTLKRIDEKEVTEKAYNNPKFCEDTARGVSQKLDEWIKKEKILDYVVVAENFESIHQSNAISIINAGKELL